MSSSDKDYAALWGIRQLDSSLYHYGSLPAERIFGPDAWKKIVCIALATDCNPMKTALMLLHTVCLVANPVIERTKILWPVTFCCIFAEPSGNGKTGACEWHAELVKKIGALVGEDYLVSNCTFVGLTSQMMESDTPHLALIKDEARGFLGTFGCMGQASRINEQQMNAQAELCGIDSLGRYSRVTADGKIELERAFSLSAGVQWEPYRRVLCGKDGRDEGGLTSRWHVTSFERLWPDSKDEVLSNFCNSYNEVSEDEYDGVMEIMKSNLINLAALNKSQVNRKLLMKPSKGLGEKTARAVVEAGSKKQRACQYLDPAQAQCHAKMPEKVMRLAPLISLLRKVLTQDGIGNRLEDVTQVLPENYNSSVDLWCWLDRVKGFASEGVTKDNVHWIESLSDADKEWFISVADGMSTSEAASNASKVASKPARKVNTMSKAEWPLEKCYSPHTTHAHTYTIFIFCASHKL